MSPRSFLVPVLVVISLAPVAARAQMPHEHAAADTTMNMPGMHHGAARAPAKPAPKRKAVPPGSHTHTRGTPASRAAPGPRAAVPHAAHAMPMAGMDMSHAAHAGHAMTGFFGPYPMTREASGTAWQPETAEHPGLHSMRGPWMLMLHGMADVVWDHQGGPRGGERLFSANMLMGMASRPLGAGTLGLRAMTSLEPATIGRKGYPLLLQTGETADGVTPLIDRQHPHDLFMELAASYSLARGKNSVFAYGGLPGEPALGPPAFMHRFSGENDPVAPITHHWLDSTHITFGVLTAGAVCDRVKVEASTFRGREPDQDRWNFDRPKLDSWSFRLSANPAARVALQVSHGRLKSPEQLEPEVDQDRTTASAMVDGRWSGGHWEGLLAWGRNRNRPGRTLDAFAAEAAAGIGDAHTVFARAERVEKDELFTEPDPLATEAFDVGEATVGYRCDFLRAPHARAGVGVAGTVAFVPRALRGVYGDRPGSVMVFAHGELR